MNLKYPLFFAPLVVIAATCILTSTTGYAERFVVPRDSDSVVGEVRFVRARADDTLIDIAREFNLGYDQIVRANPAVNRWIPGTGTEVILPHRYVLVGTARRGLVLNIAELRVYYFPPTPKGMRPEVITHPVSIGRMDWRTPLGATKVVKKERDPPWRPPPSIREEHARDGDPLPEVIPGGAPDNPLGRFALRLGFPTYLIHGVDERKAFGIGMRVTHGCVRMYPEDIEALFDLVPVNTPVFIVNEPIKLGRSGDRVFLEVHQPLEEKEDEAAPEAPRVSPYEVLQFVRQRLGPFISFDEKLVLRIAEDGNGIPHEILRTSQPLPGIDAKRIEQSPGPRTKKASVDEEYQEAIAKYLREAESDSTSSESEERLEATRRHRRASPTEEQEVDVRRYLEERY